MPPPKAPQAGTLGAVKVAAADTSDKTAPIMDAAARLATVKGHLVWYPLDFLAKERAILPDGLLQRYLSKQKWIGHVFN